MALVRPKDMGALICSNILYSDKNIFIWLYIAALLYSGTKPPISSMSLLPKSHYNLGSLLISLDLSLSRPGSYWDCRPVDGSRVPLSFKSKAQGCIDFLKFSIDGSRVLPQSSQTRAASMLSSYLIPSLENMLNTFHFGFLFWNYNKICSFMSTSILQYILPLNACLLSYPCNIWQPILEWQFDQIKTGD